MSVREIRRHLKELYGVDVSPDLVSREDPGTTCPAAVLSDHTKLAPRARRSFLTTRARRSVETKWRWESTGNWREAEGRNKRQ